jgi:RNA-directed DNA polymerase
MHARTRPTREPGDPSTCRCGSGEPCRGARREASRRTTASHIGAGKSDCGVVPQKLPNKATGRPAGAEAVEGRLRAKGNAMRARMSRRSRRTYDVVTALQGIRRTAAGRPGARFDTLMHHIYQVERLEAAYMACKRDAAAGVDGQTWLSYGQDLRARLEELSDRLARGGYDPQPVKRAYIDKADGSKRPLGVPALEDKIVQRATVEVLNAIYERDFLGFSYGFRPAKSAHHALDAVVMGVEVRRVNWILDADIAKFFDTIEHDWVMKFVEHRVADARVLRLIKSWLQAGVLEDGRVRRSEVGTVQGGSISPLLANIYLHYVLDLWVQRWRKWQARGDMIIVRYADDWVAGFERRSDAERFWREVRQRLQDFGLKLHEDKTRLIEFGRFARAERSRRGQGKPETFDFLGFTHCCDQTRQGRFIVLRLSSRKKVHAKLLAVQEELRRRMHRPIEEQGQYLRAVVGGHMRYYGVPRNAARLKLFRWRITQLWHRTLCRRTQVRPIRWARVAKIAEHWLPPARICHPYPNQRLIVGPEARAVCGSSARTDL